jgi:hypothetical protein
MFCPGVRMRCPSMLPEMSKNVPVDVWLTHGEAVAEGVMEDVGELVGVPVVAPTGDGSNARLAMVQSRPAIDCSQQPNRFVASLLQVV